MVITLKKVTYDSLPDRIQKSIMSYDRDTITIDDSKLTLAEITKLKQFFQQDGWT